MKILVLRLSSGNAQSKIRNPKFILFFCTLLFALCFSAEAQQPGKIPRIGYVAASSPEGVSAHRKVFRQGLRDLGYIEGKNILVESRYLEGMSDRSASVVAELLHLKVDLIVSTSPIVIRAAMQASKTIPIVMITVADPVATGLIDSLARPGGNVTGLTRLTQELSGKRLELFKEAVPWISRVGVLLVADSSSMQVAFKEYEAAAAALKIQLQSLEVRGPKPDFERAFREAAKRRVNALITARHGLLIRYEKQIADLAIKNRLPSMFEATDTAEAGGLMSYSANDAESFRRAAVYVDKILKGAKPADLPVEQPTKFEFVINLKTAKALGLTISPNVLARADKVIR
jgi:putative ABC transport system substrate-binding protein